MTQPDGDANAASQARIEQIRALLERNPDDTFPHYALAMELKGQGCFEAALESLDRCLSLDPKYGYAWYHKAAILKDVGRTEEARDVLQRGLEMASTAGQEQAANEIRDLLETL